MTPEEARELLKGTTPGPWGWCRNYRDEDGHEDDFMSLGNTEKTAIRTGDSSGHWSYVDGSPSDLALCAAAPLLAETIAGMQAEYAVQVSSSGEWYYLNEHGDWTIIPHFARWFWSPQDAHVLIPYAQREKFRIVRRYVTDSEVTEWEE